MEKEYSWTVREREREKKRKERKKKRSFHPRAVKLLFLLDARDGFNLLLLRLQNLAFLPSLPPDFTFTCIQTLVRLDRLLSWT